MVQNNQDGVDDNDNGDLNWGPGMLSGDPYFCNGEGGDYTVRENSNVLNGGSDGDLVGFLGVGCGPINTGPVWYVSELGNDSSDGSLETPLATIQAASMRVRMEILSGFLKENILRYLIFNLNN